MFNTEYLRELSYKAEADRQLIRIQDYLIDALEQEIESLQLRVEHLVKENYGLKFNLKGTYDIRNTQP